MRGKADFTEPKTFTYANIGWKDLLVSVDGVELTYDEIGNVLTFGNKTYEWESGRNLKKITDGSNTYSYKYDENGIRTSKTVNGVTTYYNTKDGVVISQSNGTDKMYFQYDNNGTPFGFVFNGTQYFYITNPMGDVIAITESDGEIICEYVYDEWGKHIEINYIDGVTSQQIALSNANPLRYRGYYYDSETGYYYLQSRYYDPSICRFINADIPEIAKVSKNIPAGTNLFAYCNNDPICFLDMTGFGMWIPRLTIRDYYQIHRNVQNQVIIKSRWILSMEVYVRGSKGNGRLDLYNMFTNEYYEIKSIGSAYSYKTALQMQKYDCAKTVYKSKNVIRGKSVYNGTFYYGAWQVNYYSVANGLIAYSVKWDQAMFRKAILLGAALGVIMGVIFVLNPATIPVAGVAIKIGSSLVFC